MRRAHNLGRFIPGVASTAEAKIGERASRFEEVRAFWSKKADE